MANPGYRQGRLKRVVVRGVCLEEIEVKMIAEGAGMLHGGGGAVDRAWIRIKEAGSAKTGLTARGWGKKRKEVRGTRRRVGHTFKEEIKIGDRPRGSLSWGGYTSRRK